MRPQDLFGAAPKTVLNKPYAHFQWKLTTGSYQPSLPSGVQQVTLNDTAFNDIQGCYLSGSDCVLPAGEYWVEGEYSRVATTPHDPNRLLILDGSNNPLLVGTAGRGYTDWQFGSIRVSGRIVVSVPGIIKLSRYSGSSDKGSDLRINQAPYEKFADLKIWQLDRSLEIAPKAVNGPLTSIPNVQPASPISGLDITTNGQVITVTPGACLDSTEEVAMAITSNKTWTVAGTPNLETYLFLVRLVADGTFAVKGYTTLAGPSSDGTVNAWRFISWAKNNGSGVLMPYRQVGGKIWFSGSSIPQITSSLTTSFVSYSLSAVVPVSLMKSWVAGMATNGGFTQISYDGTNVVEGTYNANSLYESTSELAPVPNIYIKYINGSTAVHVLSITLRR